MKRLLLLSCLAMPASAQTNEVALLAGYTTASPIDKTAVGITDLQVSAGFSWSAGVSHFFSTHVGIEGSVAQHRSALRISTRDGSADLFDMKVTRLEGGFVYRLLDEKARVRPFLMAGVGVASLSGDDIDAESKLAWSVGAGLKWFPSKKAGVQLQARYAPIQLNDTGSSVCDPFGFCQGSFRPFELMGGLVLRY